MGNSQLLFKNRPSCFTEQEYKAREFNILAQKTNVQVLTQIYRTD